jgi:hypothetical protein
MALFDDMFKGGLTALAVGIGAAVVAPAVVPGLRPFVKAVIKAGLVAYDQGRVALAELNEQAGDIIAEVRAELAEANGRDESEATAERTSTPRAAEAGTPTPA